MEISVACQESFTIFLKKEREKDLYDEPLRNSPFQDGVIFLMSK